jgi:hypothetical protein
MVTKIGYIWRDFIYYYLSHASKQPKHENFQRTLTNHDKCKFNFKSKHETWKKQGSNARSYPKLILKWPKVTGLYLYLYGSEDLVQRSFHGDFHMPIIQKNLFENLFSIQVNNKSIISELKNNYKSTTSL